MADTARGTATGRLILVAPVYNEQELIETFLARLQPLPAAFGLAGVVIVDDGSTDDTCQRIRAFVRGARDGPRLRLVRLTRNFGHQNAVLAGLGIACEWAEREGVDFVGVIDADLQDRPEHLADLMNAAGDADLAYAVRATRREGVLFRLLAGLFHRAISRFARITIPRGAGTFSVVRRPVARVILENADRSPYFPGLRAWVGYRQVGVPLDRDGRAAGSSKVGARGLARLAINAFLGYSDLPLKLLGILGVATLAVSTIVAVAIIALKLAGLVQVQGTALIITSIFFSLGIQSVYLMILAHILSRSASESSHKRPFLIMTNDELS